MKQWACLFFHRTVSLVFIVMAACQSVATSLPSTSSPSQTPVRSVTPSPIPTWTFTPSATPTVEELIFPYTIDGLRQHDFQSGDIHIRSLLDDENQFYTSYLIDYPSDGLKITGV